MINFPLLADLLHTALDLYINHLTRTQFPVCVSETVSHLSVGIYLNFIQQLYIIYDNHIFNAIDFVVLCFNHNGKNRISH